MQADWIQAIDSNASILNLLTDTRKLGQTSQSLFIALKGARHDGHKHLEEAYSTGVRNFLVSSNINSENLPEANILLVSDTMQALQALAVSHRNQFSYPVIGITGSNGKTIVKEWLYQLLSVKKSIVKSPKSYNSQLGVPLSVWQMDNFHNLGLFEAGISLPGEMERLEPIIRPDLGIFTNIGTAHQQGFDSEIHKVREKMRLFEHTETLICRADYPNILNEAQIWLEKNNDRKLLAWSTSGNTEISVRYELGERNQIHINKEQTFDIPFSDDASLENLTHCILVLQHLGFDQKTIQEGINTLQPVEMRLEVKEGMNQCTLINDSYNSDVESLRIALQFARQQSKGRPITLILSDILQSGEKPEQLYQKVAKLLAVHPPRRLLAVGKDINALKSLLPSAMEATFFSDSSSLLSEISSLSFQNELVLLKGARPFQFEKLVTRLEQKIHDTVLEVDLEAVIHNLNIYHQRLSPGSDMMVMIKAEGYGSGTPELARLLEFHRVAYLGVAYPDEGVSIRKSGVQLPILVLNASNSSFDTLYRYQLEPEIFQFEQVRQLALYLGEEKEMAVHIKLDTGMHRLGFVEEQIAELTEHLKKQPKIRVASVFSHLAASDNPEHDAFTHQQAAQFSSMYEQLAEGIGYRPTRHLANTSGMVRFPEYHFELVRLGIGLYGVDSCGLQAQLRAVNTLKTRISQIHFVEAGETVGYNRNGPVSRPSRIGTIAIGYADGFLRLAGNGRFSVLVQGKLAPTIGNVCMDMSMIDLTDIPEAQPGDEVIIFGAEHSVEQLSNTLETIPYEVFTNISGRVKRVYKH